jgi:DNA-directed RNA polymerase II subunit RPB1
MPQSLEAETELKHLAAVPYQIISPASNQSIIGIFQDSLLSTYLFTREAINFNSRTSMNLMAHLKTIDLKKINFDEATRSSFSLLSQIIPNITLKYKKYVNSKIKIVHPNLVFSIGLSLISLFFLIQ